MKKDKPSGVSLLAPLMRCAENNKKRNSIRPVLNRIIMQAAANYRSEDLMLEIYMAGLWHGAELMRLSAGMTIEQYLERKENENI